MVLLKLFFYSLYSRIISITYTFKAKTKYIIIGLTYIYLSNFYIYTITTFIY